MAFARVGSLGTQGSGATSFQPTFPQTPTLNNLMVCWAFDAATGALTITQGWSTAITLQLSGVVGIFYKVATASETAPTISCALGGTVFAQLAEFSGGATSAPLDQTKSASGSASPSVATNASADAAAGELVLVVGAAVYTANATKTTSHSLNNGATYTDAANNDATSSTGHFRWGYGITTGNSSGDSDSFSFTTTKISGEDLIIASFKLAAAAPPIPLPSPVVSQAVNRSLTY